jgi:glycosyltransferase involved in cell wall biosynthesis
MRIWLIVTGEPTPIDEGNPRLYRVGILAEELAKRGHNVTWWTGNTYHQKAIQRSDKTEIHELKKQSYRLILLNGMLYPQKFSIKRVINHFQNAWEFKKLSKTQDKPDVIFCCYPPIELGYSVSQYAKRNNIPIIVDFRDKWPDVIEEALSTPKKIAGFPLLLYWRTAQKYIVRNATAITGISSAFIDWALSKAKRPKSEQDIPFHLAVNPATPPKPEIKDAHNFWDQHNIIEKESQVIGCFAGMLSERYDLFSLIKGALLLNEEERQNIKIVLCGVGDAEDTLKELAGDAPHIHFAGWRGAAELYTLLRRSDFGLLPYYSTNDFKISYPNKLGEYFSAGLPVLSCLKGISGDLITEHDIGLMIEEGSADSYANAFRHTINNKAELKDMAPKAKTIYDQMFNG